MEFYLNHGPLLSPGAASQGVRVGPFGERLTFDGRAVQDGRHNRPYPGQRLSPDVATFPVHPKPSSSPHVVYKLDDDTFDADDAAAGPGGFWSRLRARRRGSRPADQGGMVRTESRQSTSSEGAVSLTSDDGVRRGFDDGPGPYELYGALNHGELVRLYSAISEYEIRWSALESLPRQPEWSFTSIPWPSISQPPTPSALDPTAVRTFLIATLGYGPDRHERLGAEMRRWQPDEFASKWLANMRSPDRARVVEGIAVVRRALLELRDELRS